jgi:hypothetical protein
MTIPEQAVERDIVERLRNRREMINYGHGNVADVPDTDCMEAADEIERLRSLVGVQRPEDVARIIDPELFERYDLEVASGRRAENGKLWADVCYGDRIAAVRAKAAAILALPHTGQPQERNWKLDVVADICQAVAELPDRTSPDDQPDMMLVTHDELQQIVTDALFAAPASPRDVHERETPVVPPIGQER